MNLNTNHTDCPTFYGKYRGVVTDNKDPNGLGRIRVRVPDVLGDQESGWAMPCVPYAGKGVGMYFIPPENALVWIEFEHGDPDYPVWTGCFWAEGEVPVSANPNETMPEQKVLKTEFATILINESAQVRSVTIETNEKPKMKIVLNKDGIEINNGKNATVKLNNNTVSINGTALEVT